MWVARGMVLAEGEDGLRLELVGSAGDKLEANLPRAAVVLAGDDVVMRRIGVALSENGLALRGGEMALWRAIPVEKRTGWSCHCIPGEQALGAGGQALGGMLRSAESELRDWC